MPTLIILLVSKNNHEAQAIAHSCQRLGLPAPIHLKTGEAAVQWVAEHQCHVCVLDQDLPGIDGLETLARLHQRKANLPVIMLGQAVDVAVAAFHGGVVDFVPKQHGFEAIIAQRVGQIGQTVAQGVGTKPLGADTAGEPLREPTYQNRLRVIGRHIDLYGYRSLNLLEVGGGFLVRVLQTGGRTPEALEFADRDFPQLVATAIAARGEPSRPRRISTLIPHRYEDLLRVLGHRLDGQLAEAITIAEFDSFVVVGGIAMVDGLEATSLAPFQAFLKGDDLNALLGSAIRRRSLPTPARSTMDRLLGKGHS